MAPYTLEEYAKADIDEVLDQLSAAEKIQLLAGPDWWTTIPIPRVGVPRIKMSDGPNGIRGSSHFLPTPAHCIPCGTAMGATFDTDLIHQAGGFLARESRAKGSSLVLGPTCNIQRNPLNGRAYESFSEDPFLSGSIAAAYVGGLQEGKIGAVIKHFVCNDMEDERLRVDCLVPERALREIYLLPFMLAQKISKPWAYMTSYSRVNGTHVSENKEILQGILRDEWKFDGLVMSDWFGTYSTSEAINAGLDLEMPGPTAWRGKLISHCINAGKISLETLDARARAVLQIIQRSAAADIELVRSNSQKELTRDTPEDRALNRRIAADAIVLLKNDLKVLPLTKGIKKIAVVGPNAKTRTVSGGGSAFLTSLYVVTPLEGIKAAAEKVGIEVEYSAGCYAHRFLPMLDGWIQTASGAPGWTASFFNEDPAQAGSQPIAVHDMLSTRLRVNDEKPKGLADTFFVSIEGYITAQETGPFELGISLVGRAELFVDGKLVVDNGVNTEQTPGASFYGLGTIEETGVVNMVAGQRYNLNIVYNNVPRPTKGPEKKQPALMMAAVRLGGAPKIEEEDAQLKAIELAQTSDAVLCFTGTTMDWEAEACDRSSMKLPGLTDEFVARLTKANPKTVIINQSGSAVSMPWIDSASTVLQSWFGGNETGNAIADVIFGTVDPSGRMPITFYKQIEDCTAHINFRSENGTVRYDEGLFVGYRGMDETNRKALFAFGEGLSYTSFEWTKIEVKNNEVIKSASDISATVSVTVKNTGSVAGRDVVQIYISQPGSGLRRPLKELKGFKKTSVLAPGKSETVTIELDKYAFSYWDDLKHSWTAEKARFIVVAAKSAKPSDKVLETELSLGRTVYWNGI
ncbi:glycoside hydrolase family 3 protein [Meredithblackwellia eburnea MCA 4105]